ncbi:PP2C family protein-serine/threonine phosphatase [Streptomyces naganishii]|uniref:PP2C family protein-serine/threonine phosphatase n=1 Tax=Streptomyces naganishii TaxID=285447 RepID=UPI001E59B66B|nr:PP2C family protein-serine/threonine phosphatase [Streptomyces naganishii]
MIRIRTGSARRMRPGAVFLAVGTGLFLKARRTLLRELRQARAAAGAAQSVLLRPLPPSVAGLGLAAAQLSADPGAAVGGDLYEVMATEHGVRVVMGDVRGHGLAALGTVAAVLGSFREAAHDEAELAGVLRRLDRALARHLRAGDPDHPAAEDFVTVLLLEITDDGALHALNCGHPWPYMLNTRGAEHLLSADVLPPLGPFPLPEDLTAVPGGRLRPGETLVLYTDGVADARDAAGRFFPLPAVLTESTRDGPASPQTILRTVFTRLLHHTRTRPRDDAAILVLTNPGHCSARPGPRRNAGSRATSPHPPADG